MRFSALASVLLPVSALSVHAQTVVSRSAPHGTFSLPSHGVAVPLLPGSRPVVHATINGRGPFRLLVETGSPVSYLLPRAYQQAFGDSATAHDTIRIGAATLTGTRMNQNGQLGVPDIDGLLGLDALYDAAIVIDFPKRELRMTKDTLPAANGRDIIQLGVASVFWTIPIAIGDRITDAILDTQSALSITVSPAHATGMPFTTAPVTVGYARGPTIGNVPVQRARLSSDARMGDIILRQPIVDILPQSPLLPASAYILGLQVLSEFELTLDQRVGRARFTRTSRVIDAPPPLYGIGLSGPVRDDGTRLVNNLTDGFPAVAAGLMQGDVILALNGKPLATVSDTEWRKAIGTPTLLTLRIRRDGVERDVQLTPRAFGF